MNVFTEEVAGKKWCPQVNDNTAGYCSGKNCMWWRWQPLMADDAYVEAVKNAAIEIEDNSPSRTKASKYVNENRAKYGLKTEPFLGSCGIVSK